MIARIGPYEVLEELGMGGFGRVYRAYDPSMKREVAIKVLASEADSDLLSRFDAEANTTGTLQHTNIVTVFQYAKDQDIPYLVMELLEGQNLQQVLKLSREGRRPPLSLLEKVEIMAQVAEGLNFAHHRKIVHRDIKPANIMVLPNGRVKIMDFGIARLTGKDATRHTRKGDLIGSLHYMSPEQFKGLDSDTLSDIFAFGVLFYEVLTGVRPFEADDPGSIMWQITSTEPAAIRELLPNCPEVLDWIVQRALSKDRDMRYQSLADVLFDIAPVRQELRQAAAGEGLAKVRPLVEAGDLDAAKAILRSVLERDSSNQQAQALWKQVGEEQQRRAIRSKISLLVNDARERLGKREHKEAIGLIEQALRLDKTDTSAQSLLQSAKQDYDAVRRSARSLADARREYQAGNLTSAHENVLAAVQADADNQEAAALLEVVAKTIEARDAERRRRELLRHVEALRVQALYRDALAVLDQLDAEQPQIPDAAVLRTRIAADMEEQQRRRRQQQLEAGARRARQLIDSGNYEGCIEFLSEFHGEFPDDEVLGELHAEAQERQAAQRRGNFIAERLAAIESSLSSGSLEDAHRLAQESLERYPRDPMLAAALARVVAAIAERERSALIAAQLAEIHQLQYRGELNAALEKAGTASRRFENDPELLALEGSLKEAVKRRDYAEDLRTMVDKVQDFLSQGRPEDAKRLLDDSADRFASEPELARLLSDTAHAQATKNEKVFVDKFMARLSGLEDAGQFSQAAEEVQRALTRYPGNQSLREAQLRTELLYGQDQYARRLAAYSAELEHLIAAGDWVRGLQRLSDGAVEFGDEPRVRELAGHLRQQMHDSQFRTLDADVRQALDSGDLQQAREQLAASAPGFAQDEGWKRLQGELEQRELFEQLLIKGEDCRHNRDFPGAESAFKKALQLNVPTQRAADLLQSAYEDRDSEIKILSQVAIVDSKVQAGDIDDAMKLLSELRLMFPNEPEVIYRLQTVASLQQRLSPTRASDQPVPANPGTAATTPADGSETQSKPISTLRNLFKRVRR